MQTNENHLKYEANILPQLVKLFLPAGERKTLNGRYFAYSFFCLKPAVQVK